MAEKSWLQEFEKASCLIAPTVKKQNGASKIAKADDGMPSSSHWSPKLKKHLCGAFPTLLLYTAAKILIDSTSLSLISMAQMLQML